MNINQPTENPNIPTELAQQIIAVRNQVSLGEGELRRLTELVVAQKYEVNQLVKQKNELEKENEKLSTGKNLLQDEIKTLESEKKALTEENIDIDERISQKIDSLNKREKAIRSMEDDTLKARSALEAEKKVLEASKDAHFKERDAFQARVSKLSEALK